MKRAGDRGQAWTWLQVFNTPSVAESWTPKDWETIVRQARRLRLLARLGHYLQRHDAWQHAPEPARDLLSADMVLSAWRTRALFWALEHVAASLADQPGPKLLLKGAAYLAQDLPIAAGRLPSDLDILVPHHDLPAAQLALQQAGWSGVALDAHDQHYYDAWSHEVPPMRHPLHPMELDLHHNILPPIARTHVDADLLLRYAAEHPWPPTEGPACPAGWSTLHPVDQVLHACVHLVVDSDLQGRVRDLVDLDGLIRSFSVHAWFWPDLQRRTEQLGWQRPLLHALRLASPVMGTPIPEQLLSALQTHKSPAAKLADRIIVSMMLASLDPGHPDLGPTWRSRAATAVLLLRYHRQRLPLKLLIPHLVHKLRVSGAKVDPQTSPSKQQPPD